MRATPRSTMANCCRARLSCPVAVRACLATLPGAPSLCCNRASHFASGSACAARPALPRPAPLQCVGVLPGRGQLPGQESCTRPFSLACTRMRATPLRPARLPCRACLPRPPLRVSINWSASPACLARPRPTPLPRLGRSDGQPGPAVAPRLPLSPLPCWRNTSLPQLHKLFWNCCFGYP
jgi:hypothetical protein